MRMEEMREERKERAEEAKMFTQLMMAAISKDK